MTVDIPASLQGRLSEPILMEWALVYYAAAAKRDAHLAAELRRLWFTRDTLQGWLESNDLEMVNMLFAYLSAAELEPLKEEILQRWPGWSGKLLANSTPILAEIAPEQAAPLIAARGEDDNIDADTLLGIIDALPLLHQQDALSLLKRVVSGHLDAELQDSLTIQLLLDRILPIALRLDAETGLCIIKARLQHSDGDAEQLLENIRPGSAEYAFCAELVNDRRNGDSEQSFADLAALFQPSAPLAELDRLSRQAETPLQLLPLVTEWVVDDDRRLIELLLDAIPADQAQQCGEPVMAIMLAAVAAATGLEVLDTASLSMQDTLTLLAADVSRVPHRDALLERLCEFPDEQVAPALLQQFAGVKRQYGGIALVSVMGALGWPQFSAAIIDSLSADGGDYLCEQGELALAQIGETAQAALIQRWDSLDFSQRIYGLGVIESVGGDAASEFLLRDFDTLFEDSAEAVCGIIEHAPDIRLLQCLEPHLQRHQRYIDQSYYISARLLGIDNSLVQQLSQRLSSYRDEQNHRRAAARRGEWYTPSVELELECPDCGMTHQYRVGSVVYSAEAEQHHFLLAEELACSACQHYSDLLITEQGTVPLAAQLLGFGAEFSGNGGHLLKHRRLPHLGSQRSVGEVLEYCQAALSQAPQDPAALIRQAICYRDGLSRPQFARRLFEQALAAQPRAAEASLALAVELSRTGQDQAALRLLEESLELKDSWTLFVTDIIKPAEHGRRFAAMYNHLLGSNPQGASGRSQLADDFLGASKKVGRNDPCPCGSGKKYKKCCLRRG